MKLTCALMADFVEEEHSWARVFTSTLDGLITGLKDDAVKFSFQVGNILEQLVFLAVVVSVVKADEPPGVDVVELIMDEALDIPFEAMGLLAVFYLYLGHLSFSCFFSRLSTGTPLGIQHISSVSCSQLALLNPPSKHYGQ
jgi:hypothetical protein